MDNPTYESVTGMNTALCGLPHEEIEYNSSTSEFGEVELHEKHTDRNVSSRGCGIF